MLHPVGQHYLLRTPLFPLSAAGLCFTENLRQHPGHETFCHGLYLSSPALHAAYLQQTADGRLTEKMKQTIYKYWLRACARSTPYANFAGCSVGNYDAHTKISLQTPDQHHESCRPDMDVIYRLLENIHADPQLLLCLRFYPNNTLYMLGKQYRYVRYKTADHRRKYFLSETAHTPYLELILETAATGRTLPQLADTLAAYDIPQEEAIPFLQLLVNSQVLCSELEPAVSGAEPLSRLWDILQRYPPAAAYHNFVLQLQDTLRQPSFNTRRLEKAVQQMETAGIHPASVTTPFQSDLYVHTRYNTLSEQIVQQILSEAGTALAALYHRNKEREEMEQFRQRFTRRYEMQEVPLCEVLDVEYGIGYGRYSNNTNAFVSDIYFDNTPAEEQSVTPLQAFLQRIFAARTPIDYSPVELQEKDLRPQSFHYPHTQFAGLLGILLGSGPEAIDNGDFRFFLKSIGGPSCANLLSRFCHTHPAVHHWVSTLTAAEEAALPPHTAFAEIIHLPQERTGNILLRPVLRRYEIPYQGNSGAAAASQVPVTDLMVSLHNGRVILRSKRLGLQLIPRLTNAHNYAADSLPMYKFLCDLQYQDAFTGIGFEDAINSDTPFTPRITYKHLILKRAIWQLQQDALKSMPAADQALPAFINDFRKTHQLPEQVVLLQGDHELLIDFRYPAAFRMLAASIQKYQSVRVAEFFGDTAAGLVQGSNGGHTHELLIPVAFTHPATSSLPVLKNKNTATVKRTFFPGDEWLYFKIYASINTGETLLQRPLKQLCSRLLKQGRIRAFFFLRYADPEPHIRIRFRLGNPDEMPVVWQSLRRSLAAFTRTGMVTAIQIDTYVREIERYGGKSMMESEQIFYHDSQAVLQLLQLQEEKWEMALTGINAYLDDFGYKLPDKIRLLTFLQQQFFLEFGGKPELLHSLNDKYRTLKDSIFRIFNKNYEPASIKVFRKRSRGIRRMAQQLPQQPDELLGSYLHMFIIRLFTTENRKYELVLYHLLLKYYQALAAMGKKAHSPS